MYDYTILVSEKVWQELLAILPTPRQNRFGRKRCSKESLLNGILQVLVNGTAWLKIGFWRCSYVSCFRYFKELQRRGKLKLIFKLVARERLDLTIGSIDTTTITSFEFSHMTGWDGFKKTVGTKVSLFVDKNGLPADVEFGKASYNDKVFLQSHIKNTFCMHKKVLNLDMLYMNLNFRREMRKKGIRVNMKVRDQDFTRKRGPKFKFDAKINQFRFMLERTNSWLKSFRHLRLRREYHPGIFKAFVYLALIIILVRYS